MAGVHMSSAAAFVEGGVQEACQESCSICLEDFCFSDPASVTSCNHEYHLQCILEWSQRSKDCPMCWQPLRLKDANSQELLDAVEIERAFHRSQQQLPAFFPSGSLEHLDYEHVQAFAGDSDFEERIMQQLAAAAMGRARRHSRRENPRSRIPIHEDEPQSIAVLANTSSPPTFPPPAGSHTVISSTPLADAAPVIPVQVDSQEQSSGQSLVPENEIAPFITAHSSRGEVNNPDGIGMAGNSSSQRQGLETGHDEKQRGTGPSERPSFSDSFKSRIMAASSRCKESLAKGTKGFREKIQSHNGVSDFGARAREMSAGVIRALERISLESPPKGNNGAITNVSLDNAALTIGEGPSAARSGVAAEPQSYTSSHRVAPQPLNNKAFIKDTGGSSGHQPDLHQVPAVPFNG